MGVKWVAILASLLMLFFLAACEKETLLARPVQTTQTNQTVVPTVQNQTQANITVLDLCANITCSQGKECIDGSCVCGQGLKPCGEECISGCCTDDECEPGFECRAHNCTKKCTLGQEYDVEYNTCLCTQGKYYCIDQKKCLDQGRCCTHADCPKFERCKPTFFLANVCVGFDGKKTCRSIADNGREEYIGIGEGARIALETVFEDQSMALKIQNQSRTLKPNHVLELDFGNVSSEGPKVIGGYCEEDVD